MWAKDERQSSLKSLKVTDKVKLSGSVCYARPVQTITKKGGLRSNSLIGSTVW